MKTTVGISKNHAKDVTTFLNKLLANEYIVYKDGGAHWNVQGPNFIGLHQFLQSQYEELDVVGWSPFDGQSFWKDLNSHNLC